MTKRCSYEWSLVAYRGAPSVLRFVRCRNKTTDESGRCYLHRGEDGRWDRRVKR